MAYSNQVNGCQIWSDYDGVGYLVDSGWGIAVETSPRAGGRYMISRLAKLKLDGQGLDDSHKARITTMLVGQRMQGVRWPIVSPALIEEAKDASPLPAYDRADRLLVYLAESSLHNLGQWVSILNIDTPAYLGGLAWSDSTGYRELEYLCLYLAQNTWIELPLFDDGSPYPQARVTVDGYSRIEERRLNLDSSQAFVAMWFDDSMADAFSNGIEPAIREAGYKPLRIDQKEHVNKIDDEIIAEIRRSRFIVADFTQGADGARGGVYYEAGVAHGLKLPVIVTCSSDAVETLHFDTEHYNHIVWADPQDLYKKLKNRILAVIGEGPETHIVS